MVFGNGKQLAYQESVDECFQSVSEGKALIADAITDKGVSTSDDASFSTMATNIRNIVARFSVLSNQASASQILSGRAAYNYAGTRINGTHSCSFSTLSNQATAAQILSGRAAYNATGSVINGTYVASGSSLRWYSTFVTTPVYDAEDHSITVSLSVSNPSIYICFTRNANNALLACGRLGSFYWYCYRPLNGIGTFLTSQPLGVSVSGNTMTLSAAYSFADRFDYNTLVNIRYAE